VRGFLFTFFSLLSFSSSFYLFFLLLLLPFAFNFVKMDGFFNKNLKKIKRTEKESGFFF